MSDDGKEDISFELPREVLDQLVVVGLRHAAEDLLSLIEKHPEGYPIEEDVEVLKAINVVLEYYGAEPADNVGASEE